MGRLAILLTFVRAIRHKITISDVKIDPGAGANITAEDFGPSGDDSHPMPGDYVYSSAVKGTGREAILGYLDPVNTPKAQPGDKIIYSRDENGVLISELWLQSDGTATLSNANGSIMLRADGGSIVTTPGSTFDCAQDGSIKGVNENGSFELQSGGVFLVNSVTIDPSGNITTPSSINSPSIVADGKELTGHDHDIAGGSSAPGPTGGNN